MLMTFQLEQVASPVDLFDKESGHLEQTRPVHSRKMLEHHYLVHTQ